MICKRDEIYPYLSPNIRYFLKFISNDIWNCINEIRITNHKPIIIDVAGVKKYITKSGFSFDASGSYTVTEDDIAIITELITKSSVYAFNKNINEGYIILPGGNRVGICGKCIVSNDVLISVNEINSFNFRLSHIKKGVSNIIFNDLFCDNKFNNTLLISPPGCGKTTFLRDIALSLSNTSKLGKIIICALIDERYEIACSYNSYESYDTGKNNFIISGYEKKRAIPLVVRTMSPDIIITDELMDKNDFSAIEYAVKAGCGVVASVHGFDENENEIAEFAFRKIFRKIVVLSKNKGPGTVEKIVDVNDFYGENYR